jgi:hypothetical protein
MSELPIPELKRHVEASHNCTAKFYKKEPVVKRFKGQTVWDGTVNIFRLENHPTAKWCYAWTTIEDSGERKFYLILGISPMPNALEAVRISIIGENQL